MTQFDPVSLYYGLQLQLVVYLNAALEMEQRLHREKEVVPAGIFYYHLQDPLLEKEEEESEQEAGEKLLRQLRPDGLLNDDQQIVRMLDRTISGSSLVIPAGLKKDGSLTAASSAISTEVFGQMSRFVTNKMTAMARQMLDGVTEAVPFEDKNGSTCDYCEYSDICGFDKKIPQRCRMRKASVNKAAVWDLIAKESESSQEESEEADQQEGGLPWQ
jgi:ATP-dependent helicase/nuclease subunit B